MRNAAARVQPGDRFLCYLTGVMRWVGALEVIRATDDQSKIWADEHFPVRFEVKPLIQLDPEHGVPMAELEGKVAFYSSPRDRGKFTRLRPNEPEPVCESPGRRAYYVVTHAGRNDAGRPPR